VWLVRSMLVLTLARSTPPQAAVPCGVFASAGAQQRLRTDVDQGA
jgi:hypothetical protein